MAATVLNPGDIAIVGYITNGSPDSFSFVNLVPLTAGTVIYFTDNGWTGTGFRGSTTTDGDGNENLIRFTANADIAAGTVISSVNTSPDFAWTKSGAIGPGGNYADLSLGQSGEQIAAFQSTNPSNPMNSGFTGVFQIDNTGAFENAIDSSTGNVLPGLSQVNNTAVLLSNLATYAAFNLNTLSGGGTKAQWLTAINNAANWTFGSSTTLPSGSITVNSGSSTPSVTLSVSSNAGSEAGQTVITVTATASSAVSGDQTVSLGVSGTNITAGDYSLSSPTITILNSQTSGSVTFTVVDDAVVESTETAVLTISNPSSGITLGATTSQAIAITDNDVVNVAPTIQETTATTFLNLPATGSGTVSGVINDPTDPAKIIGIDFAIADADTPVGNLTVTVTSNNQSVVSNANLTLTGSGASRNLKIDPVDVGLADITVTVSDGTNTTTYTINYAASAASVTPSTSRFLTGASNASTAIALDANYMLVGDDENQVLRLYDRNNSGLPINSFDYTASLGLTDVSSGLPREVDIEASTQVGNRIFWMGSQSNNDSGNNRPNRDRIFGTDISGTGASTTLSYVGRYDFLKEDIIAWDVNNGHGLGANYYGLAASAAAGVSSKISNGYNIEGLEMAPDGTTAYVAFRAPQEPTATRTKALIVPVTNFTSLLSANGGTQGTATFGAPIELDLGGRGIREIRKNASNQYVIIAGPADSATGVAPADFRLYTWTGNAADAPVLRSTDLTSLNVNGSFESIVEVPNNLSSTSQLQLLVDNGDTVYYNNGQIAKDITANYQKSRSEIVALGNPVYTLPTGAISLNTPYTQTFDSLATTGTSNTWTNGTTLAGWYSTSATYRAGTGSDNAGALYSFGSTGSTERALGSVASGSASPIYGARFFNDTGNTLTSLFINYSGEEWRNGGNTTTQKLDFAYQIGASGINSGAWTDVDSLDFASPIATATAAALDGNASANRANLSGTLTGFALAPGQEIWLRWLDTNDAGNDHGLAIDDVKVSTSPLPGITLTQSGGDTTVTEGGATDSYTVVLNTQPTADVTVAIANPGSPTQLALTPTTLTFTAANWNTPQTVTVTAVDDTLLEGLHSSTITSTVTSADSNYNGITVPPVNVSIVDNDVALVITKIHDIQGSGSVFNSAFGGTQTIEGIVVGAFQAGLSGFYVQEEDADWDADSATSEGIFVYDPTGLFSGSVGSKVRITGTVGEFTSTSTGIAGSANSSLTQLSSVSSVVNLGTFALPTATNVVLPVADASLLERYEGMLVNFSSASGPLTVTETFKLGRYAQVGLSGGDRLGQFTQFNAPSTTGYANYLANLQDNYIILDDGSNAQNPDPEIFARGGQPLSALNTLRGGDTIASISGVLDQRYEGYRVQTTTPANFLSTNAREATAPTVGGTLRVASANLLNFFNGNGIDANNDGLIDGGFPTSRGADNAVEFKRQLDKSVQEVLGLNADVFGYNEMENDGYGSTSAVQQLVNALNAATAPGTYAFVIPPASALNANGGFGGDEITVGFIYKTSAARIAPGTTAAALTTGIFDQVTTRVQRPSLAVTFERLANGSPTNETFTAVINHFKSKGSAANLPGDADQGDGQGLSNATRTAAAQQLAAWLATNPTGSTDPDYLIMGDLNSYRLEDPITTLTNAGYNSLFGPESYSYQFNGQWGSLDHALASSSLNSQITGAAKWHINSDEPIVLDYNTEFKTANQINSFYNVDPFRTSDHDPIVVGLNLQTPNTPPVAGADSVTTAEDTAVTFNVLTNDTDANGDTLTIISSTSTSNGTLVSNGNGSFTYTPTSNFNGNDSFTYTISDGKGGTSTATVALSITPVNDPVTGAPTATLAAGTEDTAYTVTAAQLLQGFSDVDIATNGQVLSVANLTASNGTVTLNNDGSYAIAPTANFNGTVTLTYDVTDSNGSTLSGQTLTYSVIDNIPPTVTITSDKTTFNAGEAAIATFTFSEVPTGFTSSDITVSGGTLTNLAVDPNNAKVYTATFTPTATNSLSGGIAIAPGTFTDAAGNDNLASNTITFSGDTLAPTAPTISSISSDTGASNSDGITSGKTLVLSGIAEANSTIQVFQGGNAIGSTSTDNSGNWSFDYSGTTLADGSYGFTAQAIDAVGNTSAASTVFNVTVDTTVSAPTLSLAVDSGVSDIDKLTNSGVVNVSGLETGASWQYSTNNGTTWTTGIGNSFTLTGDGAKSVVVRQTDLAGNTSSNSAAFTFTLDTTAPTKTATITSMTKDTGTSATDFLTNDGNAGRTYSGTLSAALVAASESLQVSVDGGVTWATATVNNRNWTFTDNTNKSDNWVIQARVADTAGNAGIIASKAVTLDQQISAASAVTLDLLAASDSGISATDNLTNVQKPTFAVTFDSTKAQVGDVVRILNSNNFALGSTTLTAAQVNAGTANVSLSVALSSGLNTLSAIHSDKAGNSVTGSSALDVTYDNQISAASAVTLDLLATSDSGISATDNITNVVLPTFAVTFDSTKTQAGDVIEIRKGSTILGSATLDAVQASAGTVDITLTTALSNGSNNLSAVHRDAAGNSVTGSSSLVVTRDTTAPSAAIVGGYTLTGVNGTTEAIATIKVSSSASSPVSFAGATATAGASGNYVLDTSTLAGSTTGTAYYLYAQDVAGNLSTASSQSVVVGTAGADTLTGVGGGGSDLLVGGSGFDKVQYAVASNAIALTGRITSSIGSVNIRTANIDVLTGIEQLDFTGTGYTSTTNSAPTANQLRGTIQTALGNNSIAAFTGVYESLSGVFTFGAANPNATLVAFDSNSSTSTNYEAVLLLGKTTTSGNIALTGGTVSLTGV